MKERDDDPVDAESDPAPSGQNEAQSVLDTSAGLALLFDEPGSEVVVDRIAEGAVMSAANLSELLVVLIRRGLGWEEILDQFISQVEIEPVTLQDAATAAKLYPAGVKAGLSLGDRLCLALATRLGLPAVTAEHVWPQVPMSVEIQLIRPRTS